MTDLEPFYGTYRGFSPTDESPCAMGELEIVVTQEQVTSRMATGLKIQRDSLPTRLLHPMDAEQIAAVYDEGSEYAKRSAGFALPNGIMLLFLQEPKGEECALLVRGNELADLLGPTILFNQEQVDRGVYRKAIEEIELTMGPNAVPQLAYGGRTGKDDKE